MINFPFWATSTSNPYTKYEINRLNDATSTILTHTITHTYIKSWTNSQNTFWGSGSVLISHSRAWEPPWVAAIANLSLRYWLIKREYLVHNIRNLYYYIIILYCTIWFIKGDTHRRDQQCRSYNSDFFPYHRQSSWRHAPSLTNRLLARVWLAEFFA